MFYCQHILGMGHLIRSMEIVRSLVSCIHYPHTHRPVVQAVNF